MKQEMCTTYRLHICMYYHWRYFERKLKLNLTIADGNLKEQNIKHIKRKKFTTYVRHICMYYQWRYFEIKLKSNLSMADGTCEEQKL